MSYLLLHNVRCEEGLFYSLSHSVLYQLSLLHAVLCGKAEESRACMPMKMEQLALLSVLLRPNEIPTCKEHGRTKRTKTE